MLSLLDVSLQFGNLINSSGCFFMLKTYPINHKWTRVYVYSKCCVSICIFIYEKYVEVI